MKKLFLLTASLALCAAVNAQSFSDDFESYTAGSYLAQSSSGKWTTWNGATGGTTDVKVVTTDAHKGKNSIYFSSTSSSGGPTDLVLPFGAAYSTGEFTLNLWLKIPNGKEAYFNLQGETTPGKAWPLSFYFNSDGTLNVTDVNSMQIISGKYSQGKWIEVNIKGHLNTATWEVWVENNLLGKTQIPYYSVASADFYPANTNNSWWLDDVSYSVNKFTYPSLNGGLGVVQLKGIKLAGINDSLKTDIRNLGTKDITSVDISVKYGSNTISQNFSGLNLKTDAVQTLNFPSMIPMVAGAGTINAYITKVNGTSPDDYTGDDSINAVVTSVTPTKDKILIGEEKTGMWCGWCVRGAVWMNYMNMNYGKYFAGIAVHNNDTLTVKSYDSYIASISPGKGYPNVVFMRDTVFDPQSLESVFLKNITKPIKSKVTNGAKWDAATRTLKVSVTAECLADINGDWRIACTLTEDSVHSSNAKFAQSNYYSFQSQNKPLVGAGHNWQKEPSKVSGNKMWYDDVARISLPAENGQQGMLPSSMKNGDKNTIDIEFQLPASWNEKQIRIISMMLDPNGKIDNGSKTTIDEAVTNGYISGVDNAEFTAAEFSIFPNPGTDYIQVNIVAAKQHNIPVAFRNAEGKVVSNYTLSSNAGCSSKLIDISALPQGVYFAEVTLNGQKITKKFVKIQ